MTELPFVAPPPAAPAPLIPPRPPFSARLALRIMQLGSIAVVIAATTRTLFELDRFLIPKELALHVTAVIAGLLMLRAIGRLAMTRVDLLLALFVLLSAISAAFATNRWLGLRGLAVSASALAIFWSARALHKAGLERQLLNAIAVAVALAAITSLMQAYGIRLDIFSLNRAPGGTLGNRNFIGHVAAFGLPAVFLAAVRAARGRAHLLAYSGVAAVAAALVLTRSRAAWLASAAVLLIFIVAVIVSRPLRGSGPILRRLALVVVAAAAGVLAALVIPNTLRWRSDNPYLDSVRNVTSYDEGSGRGRLRQYEHSLRMAIFHPLFGVGPANWPVEYPRYAPAGDRSLNPSEPGTTFNPWPSSDWIAFIAERGPAAAIVLALAIIGLALSAFRRIFAAPDAEEALLATALLATLAGVCLAGAFDAVLLLGLPTLLVWAAVGALWSPDANPQTTVERSRSIPLLMAFAIIVLAGVGAARSSAQVMAMEIFATSSERAALERASQIDPGNYRLQLRLARSGSRKQRCPHALAARSLFPNAAAAREVASGCGR